MKRSKNVLKWFQSLLILMFFLGPSVYAKDLTTAEPEEVGMCSERLSRIGNMLQTSIDKQRIKGVVALVARHNKVVYFEAFGDMDEGKRMQKDAIFRICSMTKPITAVAVMMLWEKGLFLLSDPISRYIPEFKDTKVLVKDNSDKGYKLVPPKREITIRDLLAHTSGITYGFWGQPYLAQIYLDNGVPGGGSIAEGTIAEGVKKLAKCPLLFHPGEGWEYGLNNDVLGYFVEVMSGITFDKFLEEEIFRPLKMKDTFFFLPEEKVSRLAAVYEPTPEGNISKLTEKRVRPAFLSKTESLIYDPFYSYKGPKTYFSGGGGLNSTASDYMRFCQMMLNGGELDGVRLLSPTTVDLMTRNHIGEHNMWWVGNGIKYGLGFGVVQDRDATGSILPNGTFFWGGFYFTRFYIDPKHDLVAMYFIQMHPYLQLEDIGMKFYVLTQQAIVN